MRYYSAKSAIFNKLPLDANSGMDSGSSQEMILSADSQSSGYDHQMERTGDGTRAMRLGLRIVASVGKGEKERGLG